METGRREEDEREGAVGQWFLGDVINYDSDILKGSKEDLVYEYHRKSKRHTSIHNKWNPLIFYGSAYQMTIVADSTKFSHPGYCARA